MVNNKENIIFHNIFKFSPTFHQIALTFPQMSPTFLQIPQQRRQLLRRPCLPPLRPTSRSWMVNLPPWAMCWLLNGTWTGPPFLGSLCGLERVPGAAARRSVQYRSGGFRLLMRALAPPWIFLVACLRKKIRFEGARIARLRIQTFC